MDFIIIIFFFLIAIEQFRKTVFKRLLPCHCRLVFKTFFFFFFSLSLFLQCFGHICSKN